MVTLPGINLTIALGRMVPTSAPKFIAEALQSVEVTHSDDGPGVFQIVFHADRTSGLSQDYALLSSPLLKPTNRVVLTITINGTPRILMDGFITRQELGHTREFGASTLTVTGEDISVMMDLYQFSLEYPALGDSEIALVVLAKYTLFGVLPMVVPTQSSLATLPIERVPQQNSTDRSYLRELACPHGYIFAITPGPAFLTNTAYWGPPLRIGALQKALTVDMGPATNVETISFQYDALAPVLLHGMVQDTETEEDIPVVTLGSTRLPYLASQPALIANQPFVRNQQFTDPRLGIIRALDSAQGTTDQSTDKVVSVQGELDALRYGDVLSAPGLVGVRGVGYSYDGLYYVQSVTHRISRREYKQQFTLTREGMGSLVTEVIP